MRHSAFVVFLISLAISGCAIRKVSLNEPTVAFETQSYVVVQTSPDDFTVLTRSKAAMNEIKERLGCNKQHICSGKWNGEVWTIQRLK
jgi:hypothetical protein